MTTTDELMETMAGEVAEARRAAIDLVALIAGLNSELRPLEDAKKKAVEQLKQYLTLNGLDSLADDERGIVARLQDRKGSPTFDLVTLAKETDGYALIEAAMAGMARIDATMLARFRKDAGAGWADVVAKYEMPSTGTTALIVEAQK